MPETISISEVEVKGFYFGRNVGGDLVMLLMLKLTLPSLDGLLGAEAKGMTRTEFIGNLNRARSIALETGVPVYVVFFPKYSGLTVVGSSDPAGVRKPIFKKQIHSTNCLDFSLVGTPFIGPVSRGIFPICHSLGGLVIGKCFRKDIIFPRKC